MEGVGGGEGEGKGGGGDAYLSDNPHDTNYLASVILGCFCSSLRSILQLAVDLKHQTAYPNLPLRIYAIVLKRFETELRHASEISGVQMSCPEKFDKMWVKAKVGPSLVPKM